MEEPIDYERVVEMIVFSPDWKEKERILKRVIRKLIRLETIEQINKKKNEVDQVKV